MKQIIIGITIFVFLITQFTFSQTININTSSSSIVDADILILEISMITVGKSLDSLNNSQYEKIHKILTVLKKYNYQTKDINLVESNIGNEPIVFYSTMNESSSDEKPNYSATQTYRISLNDFSIFEDLKADLIANGALLIRIMNFGTSKYEEVKSQTYLKALSDAKERVKKIYNLPYKEIRIKEIYDNTMNWEEIDLKQALTFEKHEGQEVHAEKRLLTTITNAKVEIKVLLRVEFEIIPKE